MRSTPSRCRCSPRLVRRQGARRWPRANRCVRWRMLKEPCGPRPAPGDPPGPRGWSETTFLTFPESRDAMTTLLDPPAAPPRAPQHAPEVPPSRASIRAGRLVTGVLMISPPVALAIAVPLLWGRAVSLFDIVLASVFYVVTGLGIAVGYHRLFTHRSFRAVRWLKILLASTGSMAVEGSVV